MTLYDLSRVVWRKGTRTQANGECVEVAGLRHAVAVRDSKDPEGPKLFITAGDWANLLGALKSGSHHLS